MACARPTESSATTTHHRNRRPQHPHCAARNPYHRSIAARQIEALQKNCREFGVPLFDMDSPDQGIVHVIGPELGFTQPGMTIVCGDSHTSTHGAFGALAFGIGTSEVEHVLATQSLPQRKPKTMLMRVTVALSKASRPRISRSASSARSAPMVLPATSWNMPETPFVPSRWKDA